MTWLLEAPIKPGMQFPVWFTAVYVVGLVAAVSIGYLAWSKARQLPLDSVGDRASADRSGADEAPKS